jgi:polysaccharide export outer membrane protein
MSKTDLKMKIIACMSIFFVLLTGFAGMSMVGAPETPNVKIVPITPELIYNQQVNQQRKIIAAASEKRSEDLQNYQYKIGPYDILSINVWDHPELTIPAGEFRSAEAAGHLVAENGTIFHPYVGIVHVAGKAVGERQILTKLILRTIAQPQLDLGVAAFRSPKTYIVGKVATSGLQPITDSALTVVDATNRTGGVTTAANMLNVTPSRDGVVYDIDLLAMYELGNLSQICVLQNDDILQIPDSNLQKNVRVGRSRQSVIL